MNTWQPPEFVSREQCIKDTEEVLGLPDIPITSSEDIFRISVLGMDWDLGMVVHQPADASKIPAGQAAMRYQKIVSGFAFASVRVP